MRQDVLQRAPAPVPQFIERANPHRGVDDPEQRAAPGCAQDGGAPAVAGGRRAGILRRVDARQAKKGMIDSRCAFSRISFRSASSVLVDFFCTAAALRIRGVIVAAGGEFRVGNIRVRNCRVWYSFQKSGFIRQSPQVFP